MSRLVAQLLLSPNPRGSSSRQSRARGGTAQARFVCDDGDPACGDVLAATANPSIHPRAAVEIGRTSAVIAVRAAAKSAFTSLFLGLGTVALLVGIANVVVVSVLERRSEISLRRALGADRG